MQDDNNSREKVLSLSLFQAAVENSFDMIQLLDETGTILYLNPALTRTLGYQPHEMLGRNAFDLAHPDDLPLLQSEFARALQAGRGEVSVFRFRAANGEWRWMQSTGSRLNDPPLLGTIVVNSRDVTESREARDALEKSHAQILAT
jgi:PAS domain S-box-containing protein